MGLCYGVWIAQWDSDSRVRGNDGGVVAEVVLHIDDDEGGGLGVKA